MSFLQAHSNDSNNNQSNEDWRQNLPAIFQHAKLCWGASDRTCDRPGCQEMTASFGSHNMETCRDRNCSELSCRAANTIHREVWCNYINSIKFN